MATVSMPDGRVFDIEDGQSELETYYVGQGATITKSIDSAPELPRVFNGGDGYEGEAPAQPVEQLPQGEYATPDGEQGAGESGEQPQGEPLAQPSGL